MVEGVYSRDVVHWEVFERESSEHTAQVVQQALWREQCVTAPPLEPHATALDAKSPLLLQVVVHGAANTRLKAQHDGRHRLIAREYPRRDARCKFALNALPSSIQIEKVVIPIAL